MQAQVKKIRVYPVKSFDSIELESARITQAGNIEFDRQFAFKCDDGNYLNAKRYPEILKLRSEFDLANSRIALKTENQSLDFDLRIENRELNEFISEYIHRKVMLYENMNGGFPDDVKRPGPTICSTESFELLSSWFPELSLDNLRRRFRANIELTAPGSNGFWEDEILFKQKPEISFKESKLKLVKPCPRCPVPSRDPDSSERDRTFQINFEKNRKDYRNEENHELFPHYYMFAINTDVIREGRIFSGEEILF